MKLYTYIKQIGVALSILSLSCLYTACSDETLIGPSYSNGKGGVTLNITLPAPIVITPMTKAGATDFNKINDLNIVIADGEEDQESIHAIIYYDVNNPNDNSDVTFDIKDGVPSVHFSKDYAQNNDLSSKTIFLVANYGKDLSASKPENVGALRSLQQGSSDTPGVPNGCMMFAQATDGGTHTDGDGSTGKSLKANLQRTVAMITVAIDGSGLNKNISITPTAIRLFRVPTDCYIGKPNDNVPTERITASGEFKDALQYSWQPIVGTTTQTDGYSEWRSYKTETGGHYNEDNYEDQPIAPLFMFENLHGKDFGEPLTENDHQGGKRPAGIANNPDAIDAATQNCSYLQVDANYMKVDDNGSPLFSGKVSFKFFLGANEYDNFDIERNHYYKVTLSLSGNGVTEGGQVGTDATGNTILEENPEDVTWRVDSDLSTASFITGDVNLNASGEFFIVEVAADPNVKWTIKGENNDIPFVYAYGPAWGIGDPSWNLIMGDIYLTQDQISSGKILLYVQQMVDPNYNWEITEKKQTLTLIPNDDESKATQLTITQYAPLRVTLSVTDYPYIQETFRKNQIDFLIDRIDREARPWGFYTEVLDANHSNGFDNTFHLIDKTEHDHWKMAQKYLPWGTEFHNDDGTISQDGGSAMIYALMLYNNQGNNNAPSKTPEELQNNKEFPVISRTPDGEYDEKTHFYWTIPSIEEWQIIEKAAKDKGILDERFPILDWFKYWTSDAVTKLSEPEGGNTHAFTYQFNKGLDALKEGDVYPIDQRAIRTERHRFRLISVTPDDLPPAK